MKIYRQFQKKVFCNVKVRVKLGIELDSCLFSARTSPAHHLPPRASQSSAQLRGQRKEPGKARLGLLTVTLVFASNVHEVEAFMALADITPKSVDTLPKSRAGNSSSSTFINI